MTNLSRWDNFGFSKNCVSSSYNSFSPFSKSLIYLRAFMNQHPDVKLYDTTLRDGTQGEGVNFSSLDKIRIAKELDLFGMHYIEGGWPGSNPKDVSFFERADIWITINIGLMLVDMFTTKPTKKKKKPIAQIKASSDGATEKS